MGLSRGRADINSTKTGLCDVSSLNLISANVDTIDVHVGYIAKFVDDDCLETPSVMQSHDLASALPSRRDRAKILQRQ